MYFRLYDGCNYDENINRNYSENQNSGNRPLTRLKFKKQYKRFDISGFSNGIYFLQACNKEKISVVKLVKN